MNACNVSSQQDTRRPGAECHREDEMEKCYFSNGSILCRTKICKPHKSSIHECRICSFSVLNLFKSIPFHNTDFDLLLSDLILAKTYELQWVESGGND